MKVSEHDPAGAVYVVNSKLVVEPHPAYCSQLLTDKQGKKYRNITQWRYRCRECGYYSIGYPTQGIAQGQAQQSHKCVAG